MEDVSSFCDVAPSEEVLTGNIGCLSGKMKFGCMGDPVNLVAASDRGVGLVSSQDTWSWLHGVLKPARNASVHSIMRLAAWRVFAKPMAPESQLKLLRRPGISRPISLGIALPKQSFAILPLPPKGGRGKMAKLLKS